MQESEVFCCSRSFRCGDISTEGREERLVITKVSRIFRFVPFYLCSPEHRVMLQRTSDSQGQRGWHGLAWMRGGKQCPNKMLEWRKQSQEHCYNQVMRTDWGRK